MSAKWNDPDSTYDSYVVHPEDSSDVYYKSEYATVFGMLNGNRQISEQEIAFSANSKMKIDVGNKSPVWEKGNFDVGTGECRLTLREMMTGMATYGEADVKPGKFANYKHGACYVRQVDSPAQPIVGSESQYNIKKVIKDIVKLEKEALVDWRRREIDLDAFRAIFHGASRGLLLTEDGGKGISLAGGTAGQARAPYNTYVAGQTGLTTPSATLATHNASLYTALGTLSDDDAYAFTYESHLYNSYLLDQIGGEESSVEVGGIEYRAIALIDERNMYRMMAVGGTLSNLFRDATARAEKNKALYTRQKIVLDDILYVPVRQLAWFRPTVKNDVITWGCGLTQDPRLKSFTNTSNITSTVYLRAGALLRGRRKGIEITTSVGPHGKGTSYCMHYHDGWTRMDWFSKDERSEMMNDTMLVTFNYDKGVGVAYNQ